MTDSDALAAIHAEAFDAPWDAASLSALLASPGVFAVEEADGFILIRVVADEAELDDVKKQVDDLRSLTPKHLIASQLAAITDPVAAIGAETTAELAKIEAGVGPSTFLPRTTPGSAMSAFMVESEPEPSAPVMPESEIAARIDGAAAGLEVPEPVFEVEPAPGGPVMLADVAAEPKKDERA